MEIIRQLTIVSLSHKASTESVIPISIRRILRFIGLFTFLYLTLICQNCKVYICKPMYPYLIFRWLRNGHPSDEYSRGHHQGADG